MPAFRYRARSARGELITGQLEADSTDSVAARLLASGITPIEIDSSVARDQMTVDELWRRMGGGRPSTKDLILFSRQMHTITRSGLPLLRGLKALTASTHNVLLREALEDVADSLSAGRDLASSMSRHARVFPPLYVSIVRVGESTGTLDEAFMRMHDYLGLEQEIRDRVSAATRYPAIVIVAVIAALTVITMFVIPKFEPIFRVLGDDVPLPTQIIIGASSFASSHWGAVLVALAALAAGFVAWVRSEKGRYRWDRVKLGLPVVGSIIRDAMLARLTRSLSVALASGLPINQTLGLISRAVGNAFIGERVLNLRDGVERGESLSVTATTVGLFPPLVLQMIAVGEETGAMEELLAEVADFYEREIDYSLQNLSAALEPLLIIAVGGIVLLLALGVFLPMWDMVAKAGGA